MWQGVNNAGTTVLHRVINKINHLSHNVSSSDFVWYIDGLVQDCSNSIANTLELLQSCSKPSI